MGGLTTYGDRAQHVKGRATRTLHEEKESKVFERGACLRRMGRCFVATEIDDYGFMVHLSQRYFSKKVHRMHESLLCHPRGRF
jgi:hypothetical protein